MVLSVNEIDRNRNTLKSEILAGRNGYAFFGPIREIFQNA